MSAVKARAAKNEAGARLSVNEQVLKDIRTAYVGEPEDQNLSSSAQFLRQTLEKELKNVGNAAEIKKSIQNDIDQLKRVIAPHDRITVMLVGNHSAGKSSLINWYIEEHILKASEAVETTSVAIVRRGKERTTWKGDLTFRSYPHLRDLEQIPGLKENIRTEISCSNEKQFPLLDLIDTPGLTDGTLAYPFDVDRAIEALAEHAHLVLVFLDPHKQALCRRTMTVVKRLGELCPEKLRFYLARADVLKNENERADIITQCTQELTKNLHVTHGFKLHPIYLPTFKSATSGPNRIEELCVEIQKEIESRIQDALNKWKRDCALLNDVVARVNARNSDNVKKSAWAWVWRMIAAVLFLVLLAAGAVAGTVHTKRLECNVIGLPPNVCTLIRSSSAEMLGGVFFILLLIVLFIGIFKTRTAPTISGGTKKRCKAIAAITEVQLKQQDGSVKQFMQQSTF